MRWLQGRVCGTDIGMSALSGQSPSCRVGFPMGHFPASLSTAGTSGEAGSVQGKALVRGLLSLDCMKPTAWPSPAPFSTWTRASSVNAHGNDGVSLSSGFKPKVRAGCDVLQLTYTRDHKAQPAAVRVVETHTVLMQTGDRLGHGRGPPGRLVDPHDGCSGGCGTRAFRSSTYGCEGPTPAGGPHPPRAGTGLDWKGRKFRKLQRKMRFLRRYTGLGHLVFVSLQ